MTYFPPPLESWLSFAYFQDEQQQKVKQLDKSLHTVNAKYFTNFFKCLSDQLQVSCKGLAHLKLMSIIINSTPSQTSTQTSELKEIIKENPSLTRSSLLLNDLYTITPIIAAILKDNVPHFEALLEVVENVNSPFRGGYTLAHFAAIIANPVVIDALKKRGADFDQKNDTGISANDFIYLGTDPSKENETLEIYPFKEDVCIDALKFEQTFNSKYFKRPWIKPTGLFGLYMGKDTLSNDEKDLLEEHLREQLLKLWTSEERIPRIYVSRIEQKDDGTPVALSLQTEWEVRARHPIKIGDIIEEYTGEVFCPLIEKRAPGSDGHCEGVGEFFGVFAKDGGSLGRYINDGPSNCSSAMIMIEGLPRFVYYATKDIEADEVISYPFDKKFFEKLKKKREVLSPRAIENFFLETKNLTCFSPWNVKEDQVVNLKLGQEGLTKTREFIPTEKTLEAMIKGQRNHSTLFYLLDLSRDKNAKKQLTIEQRKQLSLMGLCYYLRKSVSQKENKKE